MPPQFLVDLSRLNFEKIEIPMEEVRKYNLQRFDMEQLDGILLERPAEKLVVGFKNVRDNEFWVKGHIPGRPLLPGVVMVEAAAQLCSFYFLKHVIPGQKVFLGFAGLTNVKFRGTVVPGERLVIIAHARDMRARRAIFDTQGVVGDRLVYEGEITGMPI